MKKKYNEHFRKVELVKQELRKILQKDYCGILFQPDLVETAFNDKLGDSSSVFRVMMAIYYDFMKMRSKEWRRRPIKSAEKRKPREKFPK